VSFRSVPFLVLGFALFCGLSCPELRALEPDPAADTPELGSRAAVLIDAATGALLYAKNQDEPIPPASLTKLMTIHLALKEVKAGRVSLDEALSPPRESWAINQPPRSSLMFLAAGQRVSLRELLLGLAVPSGNDAAVAVALLLAPSVEAFSALMNQEARRLGLVNTRFVEPSGISEYNLTTALEFARFCGVYLALHPETLGELHSIPEFAYPKPENVGPAYRNRPGTIVQYNHNRLLGKIEGVDGLKTGYIDEAGYNLALTAERQGTRFIAVILGAPAGYGGERIRDEDGRKLLAWGFERFKTLRPETGPLPPLRIWKGRTNWADVVPGETLEFTVPAERGTTLYREIIPGDPIVAPLPANSIVGTLVLSDEMGELMRIPLVTTGEVSGGSWWKRFGDSAALFFRSLIRRVEQVRQGSGSSRAPGRVPR
jgi:D-alanyl-D-alanine carboxypeptidase (penicillin-binding protein 5/6)